MAEKFLITGGSGFIGTNLISYLENQDASYSILNIDKKKPVIESQVRYWEKIDILEEKKLIEIVINFNPDYVIHLAARTDLDGTSIEDYSVNTIGTQALIKAIKSVKNIKKVVFTSSMLVCKAGYSPKSDDDYNGDTIYGLSKIEMERIIKKEPGLNNKWIIVRPTSIWGPWFKTPYRDFFDMIQNRRYIDLGVRACTKTYGYVGNAIVQIMRLLESNETNGSTYYLGDEPPINISSWSREIAKGMKLPAPLTLPFWVFQLASKFGDILSKFNINFPLTSFRLKNMTTDNVIDLSSTYNICSKLPFSREEGIIKTINWLKNN